MARKKRYRRLIYCLLALDLLVMGYLGYRYLDRKIPQELHLVEGEEEKVERLFDSFWIKSERPFLHRKVALIRFSVVCLG